MIPHQFLPRDKCHRPLRDPVGAIAGLEMWRDSVIIFASGPIEVARIYSTNSRWQALRMSSDWPNNDVAAPNDPYHIISRASISCGSSSHSSGEPMTPSYLSWRNGVVCKRFDMPYTACTQILWVRKRLTVRFWRLSTPEGVSLN